MNEQVSPKYKESFFISCPMELESLLEKEVKAQGIEKFKTTSGGVLFGCEPLTALKLMLHSRIASRLFRQITRFNFADSQELVRRVAKIDWEKEIRLAQTFKIKVIFDQAAEAIFKNSLYMSQVIKDPIVDQFQERHGSRPSVDIYDPAVTIYVRLEAIRDDQGNEILDDDRRRFQAVFYIDMAGFPLSDRGYRQTTHEAPIRENLAAALVMFSDFNPKKDLYVDPMCGSGTILIEAAYIAGDIPPSYRGIRCLVEKKGRPYAFQHSNWYFTYEGLQQEFDRYLITLHKEMMEKMRHLPAGQFFGFDISKDALKETRKALSQADLGDVVSIENCDARSVQAPGKGPGIILTNPPYGERLEDEESLRSLYFDVGENFKKNFKGYRAYLLTSNVGLRKEISLQTSERIKINNGGLECRLLRYELF